MRRCVPILVAAALAVAAPARASVDVRGAVRAAARATGLKQLRPVAATALTGARFDALALRLLARDYPVQAQRADGAVYGALGLSGSLPRELAASARAANALYDERGHRLYLRAATRDAASVTGAAVRALADQHFGLGRLIGLRARDRDAAAAAEIALAGTAALAAHEAAPAPAASGTPLHRFLALERATSVAAGRRLVSQLRYYGGARAVWSALAAPPATTAQALHVDLYLGRVGASGVAPLPASTVGARLESTQTFGELDVRALLATFGVAGADSVAGGWAGGRSGVYRLAGGTRATALVLGWSDADAATAWFGALRSYVRAAFVDAAPAQCRQISCWSLRDGALAFSFRGSGSALVAAPTLADAGALADALLPVSRA